MRYPDFHLPAGLWAGVASLVLWSGPAAAQDYVVQPGDTLMSIALSELGSSAQWRTLCEINRDRIEDCNRIAVGTRLSLSDRIILQGAEPGAALSRPISAPWVERAPAAAPEAAPVLAPQPAENLMPRTDLSAAVAGPLGAGGRLPDGWSFFYQHGAQASLTVLDVTPEWIDVEITQTGASGLVHLSFVQAEDFIPALPGQSWEMSLGLALLADDGTGNWQAILAGSQWPSRDGSRSLGPFVLQPDMALTPTLQTFTGRATPTAPEMQFIHTDLRLLSKGPWRAQFRLTAPALVPAG